MIVSKNPETPQFFAAANINFAYSFPPHNELRILAARVFQAAAKSWVELNPRVMFRRWKIDAVSSEKRVWARCVLRWRVWELQREAGTAGAVFEMIGEEESDRVGIETHGGRSRPRVRGAKSAEVGVADCRNVHGERPC